ncbi:paraquat-inducible protein A [Oceanicoccus sp. KOV_DT_Chl]|uniref:paraquat-inducible protein A n=1 Tax=Oceanicoccus sp. KOV_DT_Chl TaxID=1904639 RepID=UPI000C7D62E2|nr:paraquat-inducible protein A [Oceanicoccus sp. KOV_DT_Chl]
MSTGIAQGRILCIHCYKIVAVAADHKQNHCPRCRSKLHPRLPDSLQKTWAYLIAGAAAFIPANIYPVMTVDMFGRGHPDTIVSGVITLLQEGMYPIAVLVFIASVLVPLFKLLGLLLLLLAIKQRWRINRRQATVMYRYIHFIGRWSMLDLFMISILITLVDMGGVATIHAGTGATAFATVVVLTMLAANAFDARLIWDLVDENDS